MDVMCVHSSRSSVRQGVGVANTSPVSSHFSPRGGTRRSRLEAFEKGARLAFLSPQGPEDAVATKSRKRDERGVRRKADGRCVGGRGSSPSGFCTSNIRRAGKIRPSFGTLEMWFEMGRSGAFLIAGTTPARASRGRR